MKFSQLFFESKVKSSFGHYDEELYTFAAQTSAMQICDIEAAINNYSIDDV